MYIIKNRVTGEYDNKGSNCRFSTINRSSWNKLGFAKNHVNCVLNSRHYNFNKVLDWYLDADFIEIDETGTLNVIPVIDYLKEYYKDRPPVYHSPIGDEQRRRLGLKVSE